MELSDSEIKVFRSYFESGFRTDGRKNSHFRPVDIKVGSIPAAWGSATVQYGDDDQEITVSIKGKRNL